MSHTFHVPVKFKHSMFSISNLMLDIGSYLQSVGVERDTYSIDTGEYGTLAITFDDDTDASKFKIRFSDTLTTLEHEYQESQIQIQTLMSMKVRSSASSSNQPPKIPRK